MNRLNYPCNKAPNGLCIDCTNDGPLCDFDECKYMNPDVQRLNGYIESMDGGKENDVRNLTDDETAIYESRIENEAKDTGLNIMDSDKNEP